MPNYTPCERAPSKGTPLTAAELTEADEAATLTSGCLGFIRNPYSITAATTRRYYFSLGLRNLAAQGDRPPLGSLAFVSAVPIGCGIIVIAYESEGS